MGVRLPQSPQTVLTNYQQSYRTGFIISCSKTTGVTRGYGANPEFFTLCNKVKNGGNNINLKISHAEFCKVRLRHRRSKYHGFLIRGFLFKMKITLKNKKIIHIALFFCVVIFSLFAIEVYLPKSFGNHETILYTIQKGVGDEDVAKELKNLGIIKNRLLFEVYVIVSGNHGKIEAGTYEVSSSMSMATLVKKFASGDIASKKFTIIEGWDIRDIANYFEEKKLFAKEDFLLLAKENWSQDFLLLKGKPEDLNLEGYLFPDTYEISLEQGTREVVAMMLANFTLKITPEIKQEIEHQGKSLFQIVTMASIIEKEVKSLNDKKIVSGILWKRIKNGVPLQVDATVNYITGKNDAKVDLEDTEIDSPYNTYKYYGLPKGPIANPGIESILAALYPIESDYWYYLSADNSGETIFSKTLEEHNAAIIRYFY